MIKTKKISIKKLNFLEKLYIFEILKGLSVTMRHLFENLINPSKMPTVSYPEEKIELQGNANLRTRHRIKLRKDGSPKCVACMLCSTICPAYCIKIEAGETENEVEKFPKSFDVDLSRCIMCGLCVEACPEDAIIMDTGEIPGGALDRYANYEKNGLYAFKKQLFTSSHHEKISKKGASNRLANRHIERTFK